MRCQLCGYEFNTSGLACHAKCPMGSHCNLICCPNCGYQVVDESKSWLAGLFRNWWGKAKQVQPQPANRPPMTVPLSHVPAGEKVTIHSLGQMSANRLTQLTVFGLIPGGLVEILQHDPAPVIRIGETDLALSEEILDQIWVSLMN